MAPLRLNNEPFPADRFLFPLLRSLGEIPSAHSSTTFRSDMSRVIHQSERIITGPQSPFSSKKWDGMMTSFDYNYQNAFRCHLCYADLCHARAILLKRKNTEYNSLPQSILVLVIEWRHHALLNDSSHWSRERNKSCVEQSCPGIPSRILSTAGGSWGSVRWFSYVDFDRPVSQSCAVAKSKIFWRATGQSNLADRMEDCSTGQSAVMRVGKILLRFAMRISSLVLQWPARICHF